MKFVLTITLNSRVSSNWIIHYFWRTDHSTVHSASSQKREINKEINRKLVIDENKTHKKDYNTHSIESKSLLCLLYYLYNFHWASKNLQNNNKSQCKHINSTTTSTVVGANNKANKAKISTIIQLKKIAWRKSNWLFKVSLSRQICQLKEMLRRKLLTQFSQKSSSSTCR